MDNICKEAIAYFGEKRQLLAVAEEYSEMTVQLIKALNGRLKLENLRNELADAIIVTEQLGMIYPHQLEPDMWIEVKGTTFKAMSVQVIRFMGIVINQLISTKMGEPNAETIKEAHVQIAAILPLFANYLRADEIESIVAFKKRRLKEIIENDVYSKQIAVW